MTAIALPKRGISARVSSAIRQLPVLGVVIAVEAALAAAIVVPKLAPLLLAFVGLFASVLVVARPLTSACVGLAAISTLFYETRLRFAAGPPLSQLPGVHLSEVILALLLVAAVLRPARRWWGGVAGAALAGFLVCVVVGITVAVAAGRTDLVSAVDLARPFFLLGYFYVIVRLVPDRRRARQLLDAAAALGAVTGAVSVAVAFAPGLNDLFQDPTRAFVTSDGFGSLQRVRLPGLALAYMLFWYAVYRTTFARGAQRGAWALVTAGMAGGLVVSFNRNMWVGLAAGLVVLVVSGQARVRRTLVLSTAVAATAVVALLLVSPGAGSNAVVDPLAERASTLFTPDQTLRERSLEDRADETRRAWQAVRPHLATGLGPNVPWGTSLREFTPAGDLVRVRQLFLHNQYLYLVVVAGLPALGCYLVLLLSSVVAAWSPPSRDRSLRPCAIGILMLMVSSTVTITLSNASWTVPMGILFGSIALLARLPATPASGRASG
jgi:O-antigen ligase